jgi:hypothetical protein
MQPMTRTLDGLVRFQFKHRLIGVASPKILMHEAVSVELAAAKLILT